MSALTAPSSAPVFVALRTLDPSGNRRTILVQVLSETARGVCGRRVTVLGEDRGWVRVPRQEILERVPMAEDRAGTLARSDRRSRR